MWYKTNEEYVHILKHRFLPRNFYMPIKYDRVKNHVNMTTRRKKYYICSVDCLPLPFSPQTCPF